MIRRHVIAISFLRIAPFFGAAISLAITWWILIGPIMGSDPWDGFRLFYANDQLSYARIASNVANGNPWFVEPFTLTGTSYYPSLWYYAIGRLSALTGISVPSAWTLLGGGIVSLLVSAFAVTAWKLSGQWWATLTPAFAITAGTSSSLLQGPSFEGFWQTRLDHHAVLWGPFATLFTLDAEVAATSFVALGLLAFLLASLPRTTQRMPLIVVSGLLIGVTANIQSYGFLTGLFLLATWGTVLVLLRARSGKLTTATLAILGLTLASGPLVAEFIGQMATYGCVLLAVLPAALHLSPRPNRSLLALIVPLTVAASPQLMRTFVGLLSGDAFLAYDEASTENLGVPLMKGLAAASIPILIWFAACVTPGMAIHFRALLVALPVTTIILVGNNFWGFDQEPYRFWVQTNMLSLLLLAVVAPVVFGQWHRHRIHYPRRLPAAYLVLTMAGSLYVTGLGDLFGFWDYAQRQGTITTTPNPDSDQGALESLTEDFDGFVATDPCIDPQVLGLLTSSSIVHYNVGLAWPSNTEPLQQFLAARKDGFLDFAAAQAAGITAVITSPACDSGWHPTPRDGYFPTSSNQGFQLWQISGN